MTSTRSLVFEDLHRIDTEPHTLLNSLVESLPTGRLHLLVPFLLTTPLVRLALRQGFPSSRPSVGSAALSLSGPPVLHALVRHDTGELVQPPLVQPKAARHPQIEAMLDHQAILGSWCPGRASRPTTRH